MSRQLEVKREERETKRRDKLVKALEFGFAGAIEGQGVQLLGFAIRYDAFNCLMTIKGIVSGVHSVCFIGSDSIINCILKAENDALCDALTWKADKYHTS